MACPGSVRLSETVPTPPTTEFAEEGTAAHELAEKTLHSDHGDPRAFIGEKFNGFEVDEDMAEHVAVFTDYCFDLIGRCGAENCFIEYKFDLEAFNPPAPMFGTCDFCGYDPAERTLHVADLKFGRGVVVEAKGNKQLRYYALGAAIKLCGLFPIDKVVLTIVQPRVAHPDGPVRTDPMTLDELVGYAADLLAAAHETQKPNAPLHAGDHCKFCPAAGVCPEQYKNAQAIAQVEFDAMPLDVPPAPEILPDDVFADMLGKLSILDDWSKAMWAHAHAKLERGESLPGFKLVQKRPRRYWTDEKAVEQWAKDEALEDEEYLVTKLKSPAQMEKVVGKSNMPSDLVVKRSSGYTIAPDSDPREAVCLTPGEEFAALPPGS